MAKGAVAWVFVDVPHEALEETRRFWVQALGEEPVTDQNDPTYAFFPTPVSVRIGIQRIEEGEARLHVDIAAEDVEEETRRLEELGAVHVAHVDDHEIMRDPAGLVFCVVSSRWAAGSPLPVGE